MVFQLLQPCKTLALYPGLGTRLVIHMHEQSTNHISLSKKDRPRCFAKSSLINPDHIQTISHPRWSTYSWIEYMQSDPLCKTRCMNPNMHCTQYSSTWAQTMNAAMEIQVRSQTRFTKFFLLTTHFLG